MSFERLEGAVTAHLEMKADHGDSSQIVACGQIFQVEGWPDIRNRVERTRRFFKRRVKLQEGFINKVILYVRIQIAVERLRWRFVNSELKKLRARTPRQAEASKREGVL